MGGKGILFRLKLTNLVSFSTSITSEGVGIIVVLLKNCKGSLST
jgi:hypothetical protein